MKLLLVISYSTELVNAHRSQNLPIYDNFTGRCKNNSIPGIADSNKICNFAYNINSIILYIYILY